MPLPQPARFVFVVSGALPSVTVQCRTLLELHRALVLPCAQQQGAHEVLARVRALPPFTLSEELYPHRLTVSWCDPESRPSLLVLQHGRCVLESGGLLQSLQADARNVCWLDAASYDLTITQIPCRLLRLLLPAGTRLKGLDGAVIAVKGRSWSLDLGLLLPMLQLLDQAQHQPAQLRTTPELLDSLLVYLWERLAEAGCSLTIPILEAAVEPPDPLVQLQAWLHRHLADPLELADLAAAVNLSPRRLQQLTRQRHRCTPMEWLRQQRLAQLRQKLRDPLMADQSLHALMGSLQLCNSAATRSTFVRLYGSTPAAYRRASTCQGVSAGP